MVIILGCSVLLSHLPKMLIVFKGLSAPTGLVDLLCNKFEETILFPLSRKSLRSFVSVDFAVSQLISDFSGLHCPLLSFNHRGHLRLRMMVVWIY